MSDGFYIRGRMISGSKRGVPGHVTVFNANIFGRTTGKKLWFGDIDITADEAKLKTFAASHGEELYVLREMDGRFEYETNPRWERAVAKVTNDTVTVC